MSSYKYGDSMDAELKRRLSSIFSNCKNTDALLLVNTEQQDPNFRYLTRFKSGVFEDDMLIAKRNGIELFTSELEYETAMQQKLEGMKIIKIDKRNEETVRKTLGNELRGKVIGINGNFMPAGAYLRTRKKYKPKKIFDASECFAKARLVKSEEEIRAIDKAASITRKALQKIPKYFKEGMTELQLSKKFDELSAELGSEKPSFDSIVSFGKNAALPHHMPDNTRLKRGDIVLIDVGAVVQGYCSDMTRTFIFGKDQRYSREKEIFEVVKKAQELAIQSMKPGAKGSDVDKAARAYIDSVYNGKYKGTFIHSLGHSVGLEVHDGYALYPGSKVVLKEGMVFTAEPGVYIVGFGGARIEDDVLITKEGPRLLGRGELG
ncbi:MAG: M24 family metallopeptidase [Candidatus Micrarchaeia archaeon]